MMLNKNPLGLDVIDVPPTPPTTRCME